MQQFPITRFRRNRQAAWIRDLVAEHQLSVNDLILPVFLQDGETEQEAITSLPGIYRYSIAGAIRHIQEAKELGIKAVMLFPRTPEDKKDEMGSEALNADNLMCRAIRAIKSEISGIGIICDVALDPYTSHGHDGVLIDGKVANDETVSYLGQKAVLLAEAGADYVAPSDMMDGRVAAIRYSLDQRKLQDVGIIAYAAKYASHFYGPFREAVGSKGNLQGASKATYQMDIRNGGEALAEMELDIQEGADMLIVKPGIAYLDIIHQAASRFQTPVIGYQVSGEYAMLMAAHEKGWLDYMPAMLETLIACKRAGARAIITYGAKEVGAYLRETAS